MLHDKQMLHEMPGSAYTIPYEFLSIYIIYTPSHPIYFKDVIGMLTHAHVCVTESRCHQQRLFARQRRRLIKTSATSSARPQMVKQARLHVWQRQSEKHGQRKTAARCAQCFKYCRKRPSALKVEAINNTATLRHGLLLKLHNFQYLYLT
jgi:hypothetical protein